MEECESSEPPRALRRRKPSGLWDIRGWSLEAREGDADTSIERRPESVECLPISEDRPVLARGGFSEVVLSFSLCESVSLVALELEPERGRSDVSAFFSDDMAAVCRGARSRDSTHTREVFGNLGGAAAEKASVL